MLCVCSLLLYEVVSWHGSLFNHSVQESQAEVTASALKAWQFKFLGDGRDMCRVFRSVISDNEASSTMLDPF